MPRPRKTIMRSLGEFVGHVSRAVKTPAQPDRRIELRREREEEHRETASGRVTLRRTTIEEIELPEERESPPASDR